MDNQRTFRGALLIPLIPFLAIGFVFGFIWLGLCVGASLAGEFADWIGE